MDEDHDTESEILGRTKGLCERDLQELDQMMQTYDCMQLGRKVYNFRKYHYNR
jgi:hypothetical protein